LELLSLYAPIKGPTMQSRVSSIANEIVVIYEKLTNQRLRVVSLGTRDCVMIYPPFIIFPAL